MKIAGRVGSKERWPHAGNEKCTSLVADGSYLIWRKEIIQLPLQGRVTKSQTSFCLTTMASPSIGRPHPEKKLRQTMDFGTEYRNRATGEENTIGDLLPVDSRPNAGEALVAFGGQFSCSPTAKRTLKRPHLPIRPPPNEPPATLVQFLEESHVR